VRIRRLRLDGFGAVRGEYTFDGDRLTLLLDDNERGKSTLMSAIVAGLYGLDNDRRSNKVVTPLDRWRPWDGGPYRVEVEIQTAEERLTVKRDFDRGTIEVWDQNGREVTERFREGKDGFPVGRVLLGLDAEEFEKSALVRQGDLARIVPPDARERGESSLRARLEVAADSKVGDTSASDAIGLLEGALRKYTCPEVDSSGLVDTAISRLELKLGTLDTELHELDHEMSSIQGPVDEMTRLDDEERGTREAQGAVDRDQRASLTRDLQRRYDEDQHLREEVRKLEEEAAALAPAAQLPGTAEAQFRETVGRYEEVRRNLDTLDQRRREEVARRRETLDRELSGLSTLANATSEDADRCVSLAAELRRLEDEDRRLRDDVYTLREGLATHGHEPERFKWLQDRFGNLGAEKQTLLRRQSELQLAYQTEVAALERERTESSELLRTIDTARTRRRLPGGFLIALGLAAAAAGVTIMALRGLPMWWTALIAAGFIQLAAGIAVLVSGNRLRETDRAEALRRLTDAQRRLGGLKQQRAETEVSLQILARQMGYRDQVDLLKEWGEYGRVAEESAPVMRAQQDLGTLDQRRTRAVEESREVLARFGGGNPDPATLDAIAQRIRGALGLQQNVRDLERQGARLNDEARVIEAEALGYRERAVRLLQAAGLVYDPERSWDQHAHDLAIRMQARSRHATIQQELIPRARTRLLSPTQLDELRKQLESIQSGSSDGAAPTGETRSPIELEAETRRLREALDQIQRQREDLRIKVEECWRRYHTEHPEKLIQRERIERALLRARRFKEAVELARETVQRVAADTHRRWADHLNQRVGDLLGSLGSGIDQVRFGDDLDFSVRVPGGQQLTRGKADVQLSAGARDQLYLAVRLAVGEFLARGQQPAPFLLDDVFATCDDTRTHAGMKVLVGLAARGHQVIMLTCHRSRFQAFAQQDPETWREHVQWLEVGASQPSNG
jgi:DNA repair exonuclease SbcCD ATPase subunit